MATLSDVRRLALALPETSEAMSYGNPAWKVRQKGFAWERPLRPADLAALGDSAPSGTILGIRTDGLEMKDALLASDPSVFFTTPHFDGYPAVLIVLRNITNAQLEAVLTDAWLARAPKRVVDEYLARAATARSPKPAARASRNSRP
jgi:hypothetical protein